MPITYPYRHNLSASGTCFLAPLVSRPPRSTAPADSRPRRRVVMVSRPPRSTAPADLRPRRRVVMVSRPPRSTAPADLRPRRRVVMVSRPPRSTAPANRAGYLAGVRCGRHAFTVKRRVHRSLVAVRCRGRPRTPAHTCAPHTPAPRAHPRPRIHLRPPRTPAPPRTPRAYSEARASGFLLTGAGPSVWLPPRGGLGIAS